MRFREEGGRPGDRRGFVHKKILGGISKLSGFAADIGVPGARTVSGVTGAFAGRGKGRATVPRTLTARVSTRSQAEKEAGRNLKFDFATVGRGFDQLFRGPPPGVRPTFPPIRIPGFGPRNGNGGCSDPALVMAPDGHCVAPGSGHARGHGLNGAGAVGEPVLGIYGAGVRPGSMIIDRAVCGKKMQLADDGICYNKSQISNKQRMWPAGRKPLLSGGDMRAIGIAARAGRRLEGATKRLQRLGMMKKPASRRHPALRIPVHERLTEAHVTK